MSPSNTKKEIIVIGAGVIGLTTAIKLQETGKYHVSIIAETFPTDPKTIKYTSFWAGAQLVCTRTDDKNLTKMEHETFDVVWKMSEPDSPVAGCLKRVTDRTYYPEKDDLSHPCEHLPDFRYLHPDELIPGTVHGVSFSSVTFDVPVYLNYLFSRFLGGGGSTVRGSIGHIQQVLEGGTSLFTSNANANIFPPDAVVLCAGLGARFLGGIEDKNIYPVRGQTVLLRAPWVEDMPVMYVLDGNPPYVIPRKGGDTIVGGTFHPNDWYPKPRPEITERILSEGLQLCPELAPPEIRAIRKPTVDDLRPLIVDVGVGLRPFREGGVRIGVEFMDVGPGAKDKKVPVVFNYGHGGNGYQASWGSASMVLEHLENALKQS